MNKKDLKWVSEKLNIELHKINNFINNQKINTDNRLVNIFSCDDKYELLFLLSISMKINKKLNIRELTTYLGSHLFYCKNTDTYDTHFNFDLGVKIEEKLNEIRQAELECEEYKYINYMFNFLCKGFPVHASRNSTEFGNCNSWSLEEVNKKLKTFINYFKTNVYENENNITYCYRYKSLKYVYKYKINENILNRSFYKKHITQTERSNKLMLKNKDSVRRKNDVTNIKNYNLYFDYYNKWSKQYTPGIYELDHIFPRKAFIDNDLDIKYNTFIVFWICNCSENLQFIPKDENQIKSGRYNQEEFIQWFNNMLQIILK